MQMPHAQLRLAPQYTLYILEKEQLVVLYNTKQSLLLTSPTEVAVCKYLNRPISPWISDTELFAMPEEEQRVTADLLQQKLLYYFENAEDAYVHPSL